MAWKFRPEVCSRLWCTNGFEVRGMDEAPAVGDQIEWFGAETVQVARAQDQLTKSLVLFRMNDIAG